MMMIWTVDWFERKQRYLEGLDGLELLEEVELKMEDRVCDLDLKEKFRRFFGKSLEVLMSDFDGVRWIR